MAGKSKSLKWYGKAVTAAMEQAQILGVNQTMAASATEAKQNHTWQNRTGTLEGSIDIADYAKAEADGRRDGSRRSRNQRAPGCLRFRS